MRGQFLAPFLLTPGPFHNGWLFWLCNSTQRTGLPHGNFPTKIVKGFRLNTRTFYLNNALVRFWHWHVNYHAGHYVHAAVPHRHLADLHLAIKHDLPPTPSGLAEV
jgi:fatty acid desaturase